MTTDEWHAYVAGFFDGEGSVTVARVRSGGKSDYHLMRITLSQRVKHRDVLDRVATTFGGHVTVRGQSTRVSGLWAEQAIWQLQSKPHILTFLQAIQPYCIVKSAQINLGLEFLATFISGTAYRDDLGRIHGKMLTADEIERRERLRVQMLALNATGPQRQAPSQLPPLDVQHRRRDEELLVSNPDSLVRGERHGGAKLTADIVRQMRAEFATGTRITDMARVHGVDYNTAKAAITGKTWTHID